MTELKMLRFSLGATRMGKIKNEYILGNAQVRHSGDKMREARLRWFDHVRRREERYIVLAMGLPDKRGKGRLRRRFTGAIREYMEAVKIREEDALDRRKWIGAIHCGDP